MKGWQLDREEAGLLLDDGVGQEVVRQVLLSQDLAWSNCLIWDYNPIRDWSLVLLEDALIVRPHGGLTGAVTSGWLKYGVIGGALEDALEDVGAELSLLRRLLSTTAVLHKLLETINGEIHGACPRLIFFFNGILVQSLISNLTRSPSSTHPFAKFSTSSPAMKFVEMVRGAYL